MGVREGEQEHGEPVALMSFSVTSTRDFKLAPS